MGKNAPAREKSAKLPYFPGFLPRAKAVKTAPNWAKCSPAIAEVRKFPVENGEFRASIFDFAVRADATNRVAARPT